MKLKKINHAWAVCAGCSLLMFCTLGLCCAAFSVYQPYIIAARGLTGAESSSLITARSLFGILAVPCVKPFYEKTGLRLGLTVSAVITALTFALLGLSRSYIAVAAGFALTGAMNILGGVAPAAMVLSRWFSRNSATAMGVSVAGSGLAAIVAPPVVTWMIGAWSLRAAFLAEGAFILAVAAVVWLVVRNTPAELGLEPLGGAEAAAEKTAAAAHLSRRGHAAILAAMGLMGGAMGPGVAGLSVLFSSEGFSDGVTAAALSISGFALLAGKFICGRMTDGFGARRTCLAFFWAYIAGNALCCASGAGSRALAFAAAAAIGLGFSLASVGMSVMAEGLEGKGGSEAALRSYQFAYLTGSLVSSAMPGIVFDRVGSYVPAYAVFTVFTAASAGIVARLYKKTASRGGAGKTYCQN